MRLLVGFLLLLVVIQLVTAKSEENLKKKDKAKADKTDSKKKSSKTKHHNEKSKLIEPAQLNDLIKQSDFNQTYRLIEASLDAKLVDEFNKEHIPNAIYFDALKGTKPTSVCPMNIPELEPFQEYVSSLGISNKHWIIVYDRSELGVFEAARVWWVFKIYGYENVSIVNGGLKAWKKDNLPVSNVVISHTPESFTLTLMKNRVKTFEQVFENTKTKKEILIDARDKEEFDQVDKATNKTMNIPNSVNLPFKELYDAKNSKLKAPKELKSIFKSKKIDLKKPIIVSCLKGLRANIVGFAADVLGAKQVSVYPGSWNEYSQKIKEINPASTDSKNCEL